MITPTQLAMLQPGDQTRFLVDLKAYGCPYGTVRTVVKIEDDRIYHDFGVHGVLWTDLEELELVPFVTTSFADAILKILTTPAPC